MKRSAPEQHSENAVFLHFAFRTRKLQRTVRSPVTAVLVPAPSPHSRVNVGGCFTSISRVSLLTEWNDSFTDLHEGCMEDTVGGQSFERSSDVG